MTIQISPVPAPGFFKVTGLVTKEGEPVEYVGDVKTTLERVRKFLSERNA